MNAGQAKQTAREWVEANAAGWPGLRAAHLVGGITVMPDAAPFPAAKDVDLHLVFAEGSPALQPAGPGPTIIEVAYGGLPIEAGVKSEAEYASPEAVLANPEIAYHLTVDSVLVDSDGWLRGLQEPVRRGYRQRRWVLARVEHERRGLAGALAFLPAVRETWGASGELNILGYTTTFLAAALAMATLGPPKMGGRMFVHLGELLAARGRADLHEEILALLGVNQATPARAEELLGEGAEAFDLAVRLERAPGPFLPFEHKLHPHLRPYFVDACRGMIAEGRHREALAWTTPFFLTAIDVILLAGPDEARPMFAARRDGFLRDGGFATPEARAARFAQAGDVANEVFGLAAEIVATHPDIVA